MQQYQDKYQEQSIKFYSKLVDWLAKHPQQAATGAQWHATLRNAKGLRKEEMELALPMEDIGNGLFDCKLTRALMLKTATEGIQQCSPTLLTQMTGQYTPGVKFRRIENGLVPRKVLQKHSFSRILRCYQHVSLGYRVMEVGYDDLLSNPVHWVMFDDKWHLYRRSQSQRADYQDSVTVIDDMYQMFIDRFDNYKSRAAHTFYETYALQGGKNYQEWLLCLDGWNGTPYENGHFERNNVLLHLRTSEWVDVEGNHLLLVDELQSDWNSDYRDTARQQDDAEIFVSAPPFANEWHELGIKVACMIAVKAGMKVVAFTTGESQCLRYSDTYDGLLNLYDRLIPSALTKFGKLHGAAVAWSSIETKVPGVDLRYRGRRGWEVKHLGKRLCSNIMHEKVAMAFAEAKSQKKLEDVRVFEMPASLIEKIETQGLPLFGW